MSPRFIYFDIDNTLLNHTAAEEKAQHDIYRQYDELQAVTFPEWVNGYKELNTRLWLQYQKGEIDRDSLQFTRFNGTMQQLGIPADRSMEIGTTYMNCYRRHWQWVEGAEKVLTEIAEKYPIGFITNGFLETQKLKAEFMNLNSYSNILIISEEIGVMKPHPRVFDVATSQANISRSEILYVGDSYSSDITGGKNAGWRTAWFTAFREQPINGQTADFIFDSFSALEELLVGKKN